MPKTKIIWKLFNRQNFFNYFGLLRQSFLAPIQFSTSISQKSSLGLGLIILTCNLFLAFGFQIIVENSFGQTFELIIPSLLELFLLVPIFLIILVLLSGLLFCLAKLLKGQGSFKKTVLVFSYASFPFVLSFIPYIGIFTLFLMLFLLILAFKKIHHYTALQAVATVLLPFVSILTVLWLMGIIDFDFSIGLP